MGAKGKMLILGAISVCNDAIVKNKF